MNARTLVLVLSLHLLVAPIATASESCALLPNGDFGAGFGPWTETPDVTTSGVASVPSWDAAVLDSTGVPGDLSGPALAISAFALAAADEGGLPSTVDATMSVAQDTTLADRHLQLGMGGFFEGFYFGDPDMSQEVVLVVTGPGGPVEFPLLETTFGATPSCGVGLSVLGTYVMSGPVEVDLLTDAQGGTTGLSIGDAINVAIELRVQIVADGCDDAEFSGQLWVDTVSFCDAWDAIGPGLAGTAGTPALAGSGTLAAGSPFGLSLTNGLPGGSAFLVLGFAGLGAPFKGGVLVPMPDIVIGGLPIDGAGEFTLGTTFPGGAPSDTKLFFQAWVPDAGGVKGFSATNGLRVLTP